MAKYMTEVNKRAISLQSQGRTPIILHIGANTLNAPIDEAIHGSVSKLPFIQGMPENYQVVYVEPISEKQSGIRTASQKWYSNDTVKVITAMIEGMCAEERAFYSIDPRVTKEFIPECFSELGWSPDFIPFQWYSSMSLEDTLRQIILWPNVTKFKPPYMSAECNSGLQKWADAVAANRLTNRSSYVLKTPVKCYTPTSMLSLLNAQADQLVMVAIDAEGADFDIMDKLLELDGFAPPFLQYEDNDPYKSRLDLKETLLARGYAWGEGTESAFGEEAVMNVVAFMPDGAHQ